MAWTLDHVGPICKTVEDAALMLGIIAGYDELDPTTVNAPVPDYGRAFKMQVSKLRLGLPRAGFFAAADASAWVTAPTSAAAALDRTEMRRDHQRPAVSALIGERMVGNRLHHSANAACMNTGG